MNVRRASVQSPSIDALRALAAIAVVFIHEAQILVFRGYELTWAVTGDVGILVFFVISGYLISVSVLRPRGFDRRAFLLRRGARILPLYYLSMVVAIVLIDPTPLFSADGRADVFTHLLLLHGLSEGMRFTIHGVWWTLTVEWLFYLLMTLIGPWFRRPRIGWIVAGLMVVVGLSWRYAVMQRYGVVDRKFLISQLPGYADLFGLGMMVALGLSQATVRRALSRGLLRWTLAAASAASIVVLILIYHRENADYWPGRLVGPWPFALGIALSVLLATLAFAPNPVDRVVSRTGLAYLGIVSYGIYLFHPFVIRAADRAWFAQHDTVRPAYFIAGTLAGSVLVAVIAHYSVERPAMVWSAARARSWGRTPAAASASSTATTPSAGSTATVASGKGSGRPGPEGRSAPSVGGPQAGAPADVPTPSA